MINKKYFLINIIKKIKNLMLFQLIEIKMIIFIITRYKIIKLINFGLIFYKETSDYIIWICQINKNR